MAVYREAADNGVRRDVGDTVKRESIQVLLVEDNPGDARLVREELADVRSVRFEMIHVESLGEAEEELRRDRFDVILLDLSLPDGHGLETVNRMRAGAPSVPIVVLSGNHDETVALSAVKAGAHDYLIKGQIPGPAMARVIRYAIERRNLDEALHMTQFTVDRAADAVCWIRPDGTIFYANHAAAELLGCSHEELTTKRIVDIDLTVSEEQWPGLWNDLGEQAHAVFETQWRTNDGRIVPVEVRSNHQEYDGTLYCCVYARDITERKRAEQALAKANLELQSVSRKAGMAEVASSVLHNVGNVLNSVNVSAAVVTEKLRQSKVPNLAKAAELMSEHADDLGTFISEDEKGRQLPGYLTMLADHLANEQAETIEELRSLTENVEHIKAIVSMQQSYTGMSGLVEPVKVTEMLDDVLRMNAISSESWGIVVVREYDDIPSVVVEKHKLLQILVNLIRNAQDTLVEGGEEDKRLTVRIGRMGEASVRVEVIDNGMGIPVENLTCIFAHGYTTKKDGHGFGLHGAALMAKEMGGSLTAHSDGPGKGATFTLELPLEPAMVNA